MKIVWKNIAAQHKGYRCEDIVRDQRNLSAVCNAPASFVYENPLTHGGVAVCHKHTKQFEERVINPFEHVLLVPTMEEV